VIPITVDLDDESLIAPQEVDRKGAKANVGLGLGQPGLSDQGQEATLSLRAGELRPAILLEQSPKCVCAAARRITGK
jgi:hypothetical protein